MKRRREVLLASCALLAPVSSLAQPVSRPRVIGFLVNRRPSDNPNDLVHVFIGAIRDLGWNEGKSVAFELRAAEQRYERFPELARELVGLNVDLIVVTAGVTAALAAKQATTTIPILAVGIADPVKFGLVDSMARPGGNVTGFMATDIDWGKYLELAREAAGATRIAVIGNPTNVVYADYVAKNEAAARLLGVKLLMIPVAQASDLPAAFEAMSRERSEALVFGPDPVFFANMKEIVERARAGGLPVLAPFRLAAQQGALVSYGPDGRDMMRQAASYADKLLKGTKAGDLPFVKSTHLELVVNLKTAKALGIAVPSSLQLRADELIE